MKYVKVCLLVVIWFSKLALPSSQRKIFRNYLTQKNMKKSMKILPEISYNPVAMHAMGLFYKYGVIVDQSSAKAVEVL